jgi:beta-lactamase superfamily II metal-dependent hydrolase
MPCASPPASPLSALTRIVVVLSAASVAACTSLAVTSVEPGVVEQGTGADLTITGSGFVEGVDFGLAAAGLDITLGAVTLIDEETATARLGATTPAGVYDVVARQGDTRVALEAALTVASDAARLVFIDVGQGDATLVIAPGGETMLIDGGRVESAEAIRTALDTHAAGRIDVIVISHFDVDHVGGVVELLMGSDGVAGSDDDLVVSDVLVPSGLASCDAQVCERLRAVRATTRVPVVGEEVSLGLLSPRIVAVDGVVDGAASPGEIDDNGRSVVIDVEWGGRHALILGDLTGGGLGTVDVEGPLSLVTGAVDVLRVAHHGSATSSNAAAIARWQPRVAVVSVGSENTYCHPEPSALTRVASASGTVLSTGRGIVDDAARCGQATPTFENTRMGLGDVVVTLSADGTVTHP